MKICPNCGASVEESSKFCTSCGYAFPAQNIVNEGVASPGGQATKEKKKPTATAANFESQPTKETRTQKPDSNIQLDKVKSSGKNYLNYFLDALKQPTKVGTEDQKYFGLISIGIYILIGLFVLNQVVLKVISAIMGLISNGIGSLFGNNGGSSMMNGLFGGETNTPNASDSTLADEFINRISGDLYFKGFLLLLLAFALYTASLFIVKKFIQKETDVDYFTITTEYARYFSLPIIVLFSAAILLLVNAGFLTIVAMAAIMFCGYLLTYGFIKVLRTSNQTKLDNTYIFGLVFLVDNVIIFFIAKQVLMSVIRSLSLL